MGSDLVSTVSNFLRKEEQNCLFEIENDKI